MPELDIVKLRNPDARPDLAKSTAELILDIGVYRETETVDTILRAMKNRTTIIVSEDDEVVGTAGLRVVQSGFGILEDVIIHPDRRGDGYGRFVVEATETLAVRKGVTELSLDSSRVYTTFYEYLGYENVGDTSYRKQL